MTENPRPDGGTLQPDPGSVSTICGILSNEERIHLLGYLIDDADGESTVEELAGYIAAVYSGRSRRGYKLDLVHNHLPKLSESGIIEYDPDTGTVQYVKTDVLEVLLDSKESPDSFE